MIVYDVCVVPVYERHRQPQRFRKHSCVPRCLYEHHIVYTNITLFVRTPRCLNEHNIVYTYTTLFFLHIVYHTKFATPMFYSEPNPSCSAPLLHASSNPPKKLLLFKQMTIKVLPLYVDHTYTHTTELTCPPCPALVWTCHHCLTPVWDILLDPSENV